MWLGAPRGITQRAEHGSFDASVVSFGYARNIHAGLNIKTHALDEKIGASSPRHGKTRCVRGPWSLNVSGNEIGLL